MTATASDLPYLKALKNAGSAGFTPLGWLYGNVLLELTTRALAYQRGGTFYLSEFGLAELERLEAGVVVDAG